MNKEINLIIVAMEEELSCLLEQIEYQTIKIEEETRYIFYKNNEEYLICLGKIGKVNTAFYLGQLSKEYNIKKIYNIGTSGGIATCLNICDVVIANAVKYLDVDVTGFNYELGQIPGSPVEFICDTSFLNKSLITNGFNLHIGLIGSTDSFITKKNLNSFPIEKSKPLAMEMESGAVLQVANKLKIPAVVIRSISDIVTTENNSKDFDLNLKKSCRNCVNILLQIID